MNGHISSVRWMIAFLLYLATVLIVGLLPVTTHAFDGGVITGWISAKVLAYTGMTIGGIIVAWILKKVVKQMNPIRALVGKTFYGLGVAMTLGLSKYKFTKAFWNKTIEPVFIDLIDDIVGTAVAKFIEGLKSDNPKAKIKAPDH